MRVDGDLAGPGSSDDDGSPSWLQHRPGTPRDGATPVVVSVSFGFDSSLGSEGGDRALDDLLLRTGLDNPALRGGIFGVRGGTVEAEHDDSDTPAPSDGAAKAFVAAVQDPVRVASATLTAGFVWWLTRSGGLLTSILMGIPAWRHVDLLPVLASRPDDDDEEEDDDTTVPGESRLADSALQDSVVDEMFSNTYQPFGDSRVLL
jgi:hypothetical protein